ncbi:ABC transporter substrate-binding protein [Sphingomonas immobilis]|uniref:ABC transporter substrate-binding protein n=1 Tax=Sphingomonas immobilis TaxID=3063997 RepID=A0ABT8ZZN4_9SPHN|nr:ABC transporter substrate-binding protein [Sphingomonas sp. CA1-15]MDO7843043.1 ABC transporter substrate-binding protein [Sphingomonas sp. CA1-15]
MSALARLMAPVALIAVAAPAAAQEQAVAPVQALDDGLLAIMKGGKALGFAGRSAKIGAVVDRSFDIPLMTRLTVGPAWTTTAPGDQAALVAAFRKLTISQYAGNFNDFGGESFAVDPKVETRGTDKMVKTRLNVPKGDGATLAYRLRPSGGQWKIIDVFYNNSVSQLATRRSDFAGVLAKGGAKALVTHLDQLAAKAAR